MRNLFSALTNFVKAHKPATPLRLVAKLLGAGALTAVAVSLMGTSAAHATGVPITAPVISSVVQTPLVNSSLTASWGTVTDPNGAITGYAVQYSTTGTGSWLPATPLSVTAPTTTLAISSGLTAGTTYYIHVAAKNASGIGVYSAASTGVVAINKPTVASTNVNTNGFGNLSIGFQWYSVASWADQPVTGYQVQDSTSTSGPWTNACTAVAPATTCTTSTGLVAGTTYYFKVAATNTAGTGPYSASLGILALTNTVAPTITGTTINSAGSTVLTWSAVPSAGYYTIEESTTGATGTYSTLSGAYQAYSSPATLTSVDGLVLGTGYWYKVAAVNLLGNGPYSNASVGVAYIAPPNVAPTNVTSSVSATGKATLTFTYIPTDPAHPITGYDIWRSTSPTTGFSSITTTAGSSPYTDSTAVNGTTYYYEIAGYDSITTPHDSPFSPVTAGVTPVTLPTAAPASPAATLVSGSPKLTWTAATSTAAAPVTGYDILRSTASGGTYTSVAVVSGQSTTTYTDSAAAKGTTYYYKIAANDSALTPGDGPLTTYVPSAGIVPINPPVGAPTLSTAVAAANKVTLTWTAATTSAAAPVSNYAAEYSTDGVSWTIASSSIASGTLTYAVTGLTTGTNYYFQVYALNNAGTGPVSNQKTAIPYGLPGAPGAPGASNSVANTDYLYWTSVSPTTYVPVTGYYVYRATSFAGPFTTSIKTVTPATSTSYSDTTATPGTTYYYTMASYNSYGTGPQSAVFPATGITPIHTPTTSPVLTVSPDQTTADYIDISYTSDTSTVGPASNYRIYVGPSATGPWSLYYSDATPSTHQLYYPVGNPFYAYGTFYNQFGEGPASAVVTTSAIEAPTPTPTLTATAGLNSISLSWTPAVNSTTNPFSGTYTLQKWVGGVWNTIYTGSALSYLDTSAPLVPGSNYSYLVTASNSVGSSSGSAWATVYGASNPPASFTASPGVSQNTISWNPPSDVSTSAPITGYLLQVAPSLSGTWTTVPTSGTSTSVTDTNVVNGNTYYYRVATVTTVDTSAFTTPISVTPMAIVVPAAPSLTVASGVNNITATFTSPTPLWYAIPQSYTLDYSTSPTGPWTALSYPTIPTTVTVSVGSGGLPSTGVYYFQLAATDSAGNSQFSSVSSAVADAPLAAPTVQGATNASGTNNVITWTAVASDSYQTVTGYDIFIAYPDSTHALASTPPGVLSFTDPSTQMGITAYYVTARTTLGISAQGYVDLLYAQIPSAAPTGLTVTPGNTQNSISWNQVAPTPAQPVSGYTLQRATSATGPWTTINTIPPYMGYMYNSYTDTSLTNGVTYYYQVATVDIAGSSPFSAAVSATPIGAPQGTLQAPSAVPGSESATVSWTAATSTAANPVANYVLYQYDTVLGTTQAVYTGLSLSTTVTGLTDGRLYYFYVQAVNSIGLISSPSTGVTPVLTNSVPTTAPTGFSLPANFAGSVFAIWSQVSPVTGQPVTGYVLQQATAASGPWTTIYTGINNDVYIQSATLTSGTTYYFRAAAYNSAGIGTFTPVVSTTPLSAPTSIPSIVVTATYTSPWPYATVTVTPVVGTAAAPVDSYTVSWSTSPTGPFGLYPNEVALQPNQLVNAQISGYSSGNMVPGTTYYVAVVANGNVAGAGTYSQPIQMVIAALPPATAPVMSTPVVTGTSVALSWSAVTATPAVTSYTLQRGTSATGPWTTVATSGTATTANDSALTAGAIYYYRVAANNAGGASVFSNVVSATIITAPAAPTAGGIQVSPYNATSLYVSWYNATSTTTAPVAGYNIQQATSATGPWTTVYSGTGTLINNNLSTYVVVTGLTTGTTYYYQVNAYNPAGSSAFTNVASNTPVTTPTTAPSLSATASGNQVALTWTAVTPTNVSPITGYQLFQATSATGPWTNIYQGPNLTYTATGLSPSSTYYFEVAAYNTSGTGLYSSVVTPALSAPSAAPANLAATVADSTSVISWSAVAPYSAQPVTSYVLQRGTSATGPWTVVPTTGTALSVTDTALVDGTTYYYEVAAANSAGTGTFSSAVSVTPIAAPQTAPTITTTDPGLTSIATSSTYSATFTWTTVTPTAAQPVTGYILQYATSPSGPWSAFQSTVAPTTTVTAVSRFGSSATYYIEVAAINGIGYGVFSAPYSFTTPAMSAPTTQPTFTIAQSDTGAALSVTPVTPTLTQPIAGYVFQYSTSATGPWSTAYCTLVSGTTYSCAYGLGQQLYYRAAATNAMGTGVYSSPVAFTLTQGAPNVTPTLFVIQNNYPSAGVNLSFNTSSGSYTRPVTQYVLQRATAATGPWTTLSTTACAPWFCISGGYSLGTVPTGTVYYYQLADSNSSGNGPFTSVISTSAPAPTGVTAVASGTGVQVSWNAVPTITTNFGSFPAISGYTIQRSTSATGPWTTSYTTPNSTSLSWVVDTTGLTAGTTYYYQVQVSGNNASPGLFSSPASVVPVVAPATPTGLVVTAGDTTNTISWNANTVSAAAPVTAYILQLQNSNYSGGWQNIYTGPLLSYTHTGLTDGTTYVYRLYAYNAAGISNFTATVSGTPMLILTPPAPPTGLTVTTGDTTASISWNAVTSTPNQPVTGYILQRSTQSSGGTWVSMPTTSTTISDVGLTDGTTYYYQVQTTGTGGNSAFSAQVTGTPTLALLPPPTPGGIIGNGSDTLAVLNWVAVPSTLHQPVSGYTIQRSLSSTSGFQTLVVLTDPTANNYVDTGLSNGTVYYYQIQTNGAGGNSAFSTPGGIIPIAVPATPAGLTVTAGDTTTSVSWNAVPNTAAAPMIGYILQRSTQASGGTWTTVPSSGTTASDTGLTNGTTYYYQVQTTGNAGNSAFSAPVSATPVHPVAPVTPTGLTVTAGDTTASISWNAVTSTPAAPVTGYTLQRSLQPSGGAWTNVPVTGTTASDTGLTDGVTYYYQVQANGSAGNSAFSSPVSATPTLVISAPPAPGNFAVAAGDTVDNLSWSAVASTLHQPATGYVVQQGPTATGPWQTLTTITNLATTSYQDAGLTDGTTYYYQVGTTSTGFPTVFSPVVAATPVFVISAPPAPGGFTVTPGNSYVSLSWSAVASTPHNPASSYLLQRSPSGTGTWSTLIATFDLTTLTYQDTAVSNGTAYDYRVGTVGSAGTTYSAIVTATPILTAPLTAPGNVTVTYYSPGLATVSWNPVASTPTAPVTSYNVVVGGAGAGSGTVPAGTTSTIFGGLTSGSVWTFTVQAAGPGGPGPTSAPVGYVGQ